MLINILLELRKAENIALLMLAILLTILLNSIISEVNSCVLTLINLVLGRRSPEVAFLEEENFVLLSQQNPDSYIEFAFSN